jgi:HJR/Mrr/RecB family endonuclease
MTMRDDDNPSLRGLLAEVFGTQPDNQAAMSKIAVQRLHDMVDAAERDQNTMELILRVQTRDGVEFTERIRSEDQLADFFPEFGFDDIEDESTFYFGGTNKLPRETIDEVLGSMDGLFLSIVPTQKVLFTAPAGLMLPSFIVEMSGVNEKLIKHLASYPEQLHFLNPRLFEELVAEIFRDLGYEVILTPQSRDGGFDIKAIKKDSVGVLLYLIECKRYAPDRPVGIEIVRSLHGVANHERASYGVVATTSRFTRLAKEFATEIEHQMSLRDFNDLTKWLKEYGISKRRAGAS